VSDLTSCYVERWFVTKEALANQCGLSEQALDELLNAKAAPGVVYSRNVSGEWWSALAGYTGKSPSAPAAGGEDRYAPAAVYWLRRAVLIMRDGSSAEEAAAQNRKDFAAQFVDALESEPLAPTNYPDAFENGVVKIAMATSIANQEWDAWTSGAYAVCLRSFTGQSCVAKESLARFLRVNAQAGGMSHPPIEVLDQIERLSIWLMPFAPFEREQGTPGLAIDMNLEHLKLGRENPYGFAQPEKVA
jgi:hypothetical protein